MKPPYHPGRVSRFWKFSSVWKIEPWLFHYIITIRFFNSFQSTFSDKTLQKKQTCFLWPAALKKMKMLHNFCCFRKALLP